MLDVILGESWFNILKDEFNKQYMLDLRQFVISRRKSVTVYPKAESVFRAYKTLPYNDVKVVILGQDPYIKKDEANGLAFSTDGKSTPSLRKIKEAVEKDCYKGLDLNWDNNLIRWAEQGVLLLNTVLTVDENVSNSHANKGWEQFTLKTIQELDKKGNVIFLLWGKYAEGYDKYITKGINNSIICEHPVAASYSNRAWNNNDCFNKTNDILRILGEQQIQW